LLAFMSGEKTPQVAAPPGVVAQAT
jgi:hypothetical protein